mmetsp:Transcript_87513/g.144858  ORF Transcript_87513/g.144858 Transcript_87513/m.144858 type:complete len:350 (+) Transcript_87513:86-1135(+)
MSMVHRPAAPAAGTGARSLALRGVFAEALLRSVSTFFVKYRSLQSMLIGGLLVTGIRQLYEWWLRRRKGKMNWQRHIDFSEVQACILSTEHLHSLGRVEKRTLFVKDIKTVFRNDYILSQVLEAAERVGASSDSMLLPELSAEDKWHVLNVCTNHLSACFAPYHVFFNEARRVESVYKSAWYCFTITCHQTTAHGRWFITPYKPVGVDDVGSLRIRIVLMNEQELREIAGGDQEPPATFFNGRHESRWRVCERFADLFQRQLRRVAGSSDVNADWGKNLCGRMSKKERSMETLHRFNETAPEYTAEDNCILRLHVPFPSAMSINLSGDGKDLFTPRLEDSVSKDVVLFE